MSRMRPAAAAAAAAGASSSIIRLSGARHGEVALGQQAGVEERPVQGAIRVVDEVALAQGIERVLAPGWSSRAKASESLTLAT